MRCPQCESETAEANNFCRRCGKSMPLNEHSTKLLSKQRPLNTEPVENESKNGPSSNRQQNKTEIASGFQDEELGPNIDQGAILQSSLKCVLALGLLTPIIHFSATVFANPEQNTPTQPDPIVYAFIQATVSGLFLAIIFTPMGIPRKGKFSWSKIAQDTFQQFLKGWSALWVTWLLLYLYLGVISLIHKDMKLVPNASIQVTVDFLNVSTSAVFFYIFLVLDMPSVSTKTDPDRNREFRKSFIIVILISILIFLFSSLGRLIQGKYEVGVYLSGIFAAISMAYVFGRLDSHYMNVNRWMLAPLYLYAVIQVIGPILVDFSGKTDVDYGTMFFAAALILKMYLFIVVTYWLQNGSFEGYFNTASKLH